MSEPTTPSYPPPPPPSYPPLPPSGESPNRKVMVILAYLWLLALIPFLVEKNDREVQWHAKNGLVLTAVEFVVWIAFVVMTALIHFLACLGCFAHMAVFLVFLVIRILCIVKATNGERFIIPVLSDYTDKF
ncbi:MAG: hypothetical protein QOJ16_4773 [Acidobacteriota bacterium]|jgi:uncharacterized membrane protein|nr:hypothetical protein [Acidobacteriota bacterium]